MGTHFIQSGKNILGIFSLLLLFETSNVSAQTSDKNAVTLFRQTFFNCFTFDLPDNLTRTSEPMAEKAYDIIVYDNEKDSVDVSIRRKKEGASLDDAKKLAESMAASFYNGTIQKSEIRKINGQDVLVFLMTGHWNGAAELSTWLKCLVISKGFMYQFLIRFPKNYAKYPEDMLNKMINSISVCK